MIYIIYTKQRYTALDEQITINHQWFTEAVDEKIALNNYCKKYDLDIISIKTENPNFLEATVTCEYQLYSTNVKIYPLKLDF